MHKDIINITVLSDIHFGHNTNKSSFIANNLYSWFKRYSKTLELSDMMIISGDVFDKLLSPSSKDSLVAYRWLTYLIIFCVEHNIKLRILEGTPSHDRKQVQLLDEIITNLDIDNLDYRYVPELDYEYIDDLDLSILYIPDVWKPTAEAVYKDVIKELNNIGKDKVDVIVMHGAFKYQMPGIESDQFHDEKLYNNLVNYLIISGHIHDTSTYDKILVPGSFDRLTHADGLKRKGGYFITIDKTNNKVNYKFLENKNALPFITLDITDLSITDIDAKLKNISNKYTISHVRLVNKKDNSDTLLYVNELKTKYPNLTITQTSKIKEEDKTLSLGNKTNIDHKTLDDDVIIGFINEEIRTLEDDELKRIILEEYKLISQQ